MRTEQLPRVASLAPWERSPASYSTPVVGLIFLVNVFGCASSPDVKIASTQMMSGLAELRAANAAFQRRYVEEVEATRAEIEKAIVARMVRNRIEELSADLSSPDWQREFESRGLIALSEEIESARDEAYSLVEIVNSQEVDPDSSAESALAAVKRNMAKGLRASAKTFRDQGDLQTAQELEARAAALESGGRLSGDDPILEAYFVTILELAAMKREIPANMRQLDVLVRLLEETHAVIHDYIMTDVTLSGEQVGKLLNEHAETLGFTPARNGGLP